MRGEGEIVTKSSRTGFSLKAGDSHYFNASILHTVRALSVAFSPCFGYVAHNATCCTVVYLPQEACSPSRGEGR